MQKLVKRLEVHLQDGMGGVKMENCWEAVESVFFSDWFTNAVLKYWV